MHSDEPGLPAGGSQHSRPRSMRAVERLPRLSPAYSWALYPALILAAVVFSTVKPINDFDCWFHLAHGRYVAQNGHFPPGDIFSHTAAGNEWISSGWLPSLLMHWLFQTFGPGGAGLLGMVCAVVALACLALYWTGVRVYGNRGTVVLLILTSLVASASRFAPRPDVFSQLFVALFAILLTTAETSLPAQNGRLPKRLWLLPVLMALWANLHAGFVAGLVIVGIYGVWSLLRLRRNGEHWRLMGALCCGLCFVSWLINPYGPRLVVLPAKIGLISSLYTIFEWMPLVSTSARTALPAPVYIGFFLLVGLAILIVVSDWRNIAGWKLALLVAFFFFALGQRRHLNLLAFMFPALLLPHMGRFEQWLGRWPALLPSLAALGATAVCFLQFQGSFQTGRGLPQSGRNCAILPCIATDFLSQNRPPSPMFNDYAAGGYLLYHLGPQTKVFIDGRLDVYGSSVWKDYRAFTQGQLAIGDLVRRYGVGTFFIDVSQAFTYVDHPASRLAGRGDMHLVYFDDRYGIFVQESPASKAYVNQWGFRYADPFNPSKLRAAMAKPELADAATSEVQRAIDVSGGSANAYALAALAEHYAGNREGAEYMLGFAFARHPEGDLPRKVAMVMEGKARF